MCMCMCFVIHFICSISDRLLTYNSYIIIRVSPFSEIPSNKQIMEKLICLVKQTEKKIDCSQFSTYSMYKTVLKVSSTCFSCA